MKAIIAIILVSGLCAAPCLADSSLTLYKGWNFVSVPVLNPVYQYPGYQFYSLFSGVDTAGHSSWRYSAGTGLWEKMYPGTALSPLDGIWIFSNNSMTIPVHGDNSVAPSPKPIYQGWNAVGFAGMETQAGIAFSSLSGTWQILMGYSGQFQQYGRTIFDSEPTRNIPAEPGQGYWLYAGGPGQYSLSPITGTAIPTAVPTSVPTTSVVTTTTTLPVTSPTTTITTIPTSVPVTTTAPTSIITTEPTTITPTPTVTVTTIPTSAPVTTAVPTTTITTYPTTVSPSPTPTGLQPGTQVSSRTVFGTRFGWYQYQVLVHANGTTTQADLKTEISSDQFQGTPAVHYKNTMVLTGQGITIITDIFYSTSFDAILGGTLTTIMNGQTITTPIPANQLHTYAGANFQKESILIYQGTETVTVPAGTFLTKKYTAGVDNGSATYWVADGVPVPVKYYILSNDGSDVTAELEGWG